MEVTNMSAKKFYSFLIAFFLIVGVMALVMRGKYDPASIATLAAVIIFLIVFVLTPVYFIFFRGLKIIISGQGIDFGSSYSGPFDENPGPALLQVQFAGKPRLFIPWSLVSEIYLPHIFANQFNFIVKTTQNKYYRIMAYSGHAIKIVDAIKQQKKGHLVKEIAPSLKPFL